MPSRQPGPKRSDLIPLDIGGIAGSFPQRAFDLVELFGYKPYEWQAEELAILTNPADRPSLAYEQVARKNGKTGLGSMVSLCELCLHDSRHIYAVSDSQNNLSSVFWLELMDALHRSGQAEHFRIYQARVENPANGSFIQLRPGNFAASQGINPHLVIADEVHLIVREVFNGYIMATSARSDALVLGLTTPGYNVDSVAHDLYLDAKTGVDPDLHARIHEPSDPECTVDNRKAWGESNPAIDEVPGLRAALARNCRRMPENDFRRFHLGQWTTTEKAWLPYGAFRARIVDEPIPDDAVCWLALDGSWSGDTTGLVVCSYEPRRLEVVGHWAPPVIGSGDWRVPIADVEQRIRDTAARFENLEEIVCDPARWARTMQALADEGLPIVEFPQSSQRLIPATAHFYNAVMDGELEWYGENGGQALEAHVSAAEVKETDSGSLIRKPAFAPAASHIDLAVCGVMAHDRAVRYADFDLEVTWLNSQLLGGS